MNKLIIGLLWAASTLVAGPLIHTEGTVTVSADSLQEGHRVFNYTLNRPSGYRTDWQLVFSTGTVAGKSCPYVDVYYSFATEATVRQAGVSGYALLSTPVIYRMTRPTIRKVVCKFTSHTTTQ